MRTKWIDATKKLPELVGKFQESDYVLAIDEQTSQQVVCWYTPDSGWRVAHHRASSEPITVSHWMPLPKPPITK